MGQRERGASFREIAIAVRRSVATVVDAWRAWAEEGRTQRARGTGAIRRTTQREDRLLRLMALRDRRRTTFMVCSSRKANSTPYRIPQIAHYGPEILPSTLGAPADGKSSSSTS